MKYTIIDATLGEVKPCEACLIDNELYLKTLDVNNGKVTVIRVSDGKLAELNIDTKVIKVATELITDYDKEVESFNIDE